MNTHQVDEWLVEFRKEYESVVALGNQRYDVVLCPAFPFVMQVGDWIEKTDLQWRVSLGLQNVSPYGAGSYTGEVSGENLVDLHVKFAIVGHSERRKYFKESSLDVSKRVESCLEEGITPIVCVDRFEIEQQADFIDRKHYSQIIVAYEPVEHIGTGIAEDVNEVLKAMDEVRRAFPKAQVIYGGSINPDNVDQFAPHDEIEGFLVGGASLSVQQFVQILKS